MKEFELYSPSMNLKRKPRLSPVKNKTIIISDTESTDKMIDDYFALNSADSLLNESLAKENHDQLVSKLENSFAQLISYYNFKIHYFP